MTIYNPTPWDQALTRILKTDMHYIQRAARRAEISEIKFLHCIIEKHRRSGD